MPAHTFGLLPVAAVATILVAQPALAQDADACRTIEIETTEVTAPDVAITPDGEWLCPSGRETIISRYFRETSPGDRSALSPGDACSGFTSLDVGTLRRGFIDVR